MGGCQSSEAVSLQNNNSTHGAAIVTHENINKHNNYGDSSAHEKSAKNSENSDSTERNSLHSATTRETALSEDYSVHRRKSALHELIDNRTGDLTSNIVHIEEPDFGLPIEDVYDGVHTGDVLGSGVSGLVRKVIHKATGIEYAVKCMDLGLLKTEESLEQLRQEIYIMCQLDHPNILRLEEVYQSASEIYLIQELCRGGELFDRLDEQPDYHYTEKQCAKLIKKMLSSLKYLHTKKIIHRDLKLENFLFSSEDPNSELKMIDFGLSKHFKFGETQHEAVGTPYTVAPEVIRGNYDEKCDVWAIGVIAFLLLSGEPPFGGCGGPEPLSVVRNNILTGNFQFEPAEIWENVSQEAKDFICSLLVIDPTQRPSAQEARSSKWLKKWTVEENKEKGSAQISPHVIDALVKFKEFSDIRKLLTEVLSYTLMPEQIEGLQKEFEKIDTEGSGEITLSELKKVLMESAYTGSLGVLKEEEVEEIFNAMRVRKDDPTIHWHEFIAASISQCNVDDRNLRLAFDRLDKHHKGYIVVEDIIDILGYEGYGSEDIYRKMFSECTINQHHSIEEHRLSYDDFMHLIKGQTKQLPDDYRECNPIHALTKTKSTVKQDLFVVPEFASTQGEDIAAAREIQSSSLMSFRSPSISSLDDSIKDLRGNLARNRSIYRLHRTTRLAVLDACKRFDELQLCHLREEKEREIHNHEKKSLGAGLVMKRGTEKQLTTEEIRKLLLERQKEQQKLLDKATKLAGRGRRQRKKTVSDMTLMIAKPTESNSPSDNNLKVIHSSAYFMKVDSSSCPPSPALGDTTPPTPSHNGTDKATLPSLPSLTLEN